MNLPFIGPMFSQSKLVRLGNLLRLLATFSNKNLVNIFKSFIELYNPLTQTAKLRLFHVTFDPLKNMGGYFAIVQKDQVKTVCSVPKDAAFSEISERKSGQSTRPAAPSAQASW